MEEFIGAADGLNDFRDPPGGTCSVQDCDREAVVEFTVRAGLDGALHQVRMCGVHQMELMVPAPALTEDDITIVETCEIEFEGKRLRVEDARLIREDPNG